MALIARRWLFGVGVVVTLAVFGPVASRAQAPSAPPPPSSAATPSAHSVSATESAAAAKGVRCPADFETLFEQATKVLRCRRDVVTWVVTACPDKEFSTYSARPGADSCGPTEIPGVGTPPGASGSRAVACASAGFTLVTDRTGARDRCERVDRVFVLPRAVP